MSWMMDTYSQQVGYSVPGVVTGKPLCIGGSLGREEATGRGVVYTVLESLDHLDIPVDGSTAVIQGLGNVGSHTARLLDKAGVRVMAISDSGGGIYNKKGLDVLSVLQYKKEHKTLNGFRYAEPISHSEILTLPCTILVPAALGGQITSSNADKIRCRIVAEGANSPTTLEADRILRDRGIFVIPDILANAGGVIVSYFEWVQDLQKYFWKEKEINDNLHDILATAFGTVLQSASQNKMDMRTASMMLALRKISEAHLARGLYP
jgi:glutamate dehydrogenase (NAD(P)+)